MIQSLMLSVSANLLYVKTLNTFRSSLVSSLLVVSILVFDDDDDDCLLDYDRKYIPNGNSFEEHTYPRLGLFHRCLLSHRRLLHRLLLLSVRLYTVLLAIQWATCGFVFFFEGINGFCLIGCSGGGGRSP